LLLIDFKGYVEKLARTIATEHRVLIVGGPMDTGKTTRLMFKADVPKDSTTVSSIST